MLNTEQVSEETTVPLQPQMWQSLWLWSVGGSAGQAILFHSRDVRMLVANASSVQQHTSSFSPKRDTKPRQKRHYFKVNNTFHLKYIAPIGCVPDKENTIKQYLWGPSLPQSSKRTLISFRRDKERTDIFYFWKIVL